MIRLLPKQESFFDLLDRQVSVVEEAAKFLANLLGDYRDVKEAAFKLNSLEHDADEILHTIVKN